MADTQRTRAALLALFADNVTGQISAQDLRDFTVTVMESEFSNPGDFWKQPSVKAITTDKTGKGWIDYSQIVGSDCSFGNVLYLAASGVWKKANVATSGTTGIVGLALNSYVAGDSTAQILRKGVIYDSSFSAVFSGYIGKPVYLASGVAGSITVVKPTNSVLVIGWVEPSDGGEVAIGKYRFDPQWAIVGV
jgi:hypothetical protein